MTKVAAPARIPITRPVIGAEELAAVREPLESGWLVQGPFVSQFETRFGAYVGAPYAVATSSCTTALHAVVAALGLRPGDEVIVPAFTWVATANVVEYMGATPVFCDIDLSTFNIDVAAVESLVTSRTVGIIPVHLFGLSADMAPILEIASRHHLWVVEDAACGFGARYSGRHVGTLGNAGCFSFHPRKSITTGEGGMITTSDNRLAEKTRSLRDHGATRSDLDRHTGQAGYLLADYDDLGYNYRLTDLQAAIGVAQMDRADWVLARRRDLAARYDQALTDLEWLVPPTVPNGSQHGYQSYVSLFAPEPPDLERLQDLSRHRNAVMKAMDELGIATRQGTHAPVLQGYYARKYSLAPEAFPTSVIADRLSISLPLYPQMTDAEQDRVVESLRVVFAASV
jgi:perosamine synthetase